MYRRRLWPFYNAFPGDKIQNWILFPGFSWKDINFWTQSWTENKFSIIFDTDTVFVAHKWDSAVWENTTWDCNMLSFWSTESLGHWDATVIRICQLKIDSWWLALNGNDISCRLSLKIRNVRTGPKWIPVAYKFLRKICSKYDYHLQSTDFPDTISWPRPRPKTVPQSGSLTGLSSGHLRLKWTISWPKAAFNKIVCEINFIIFSYDFLWRDHGTFM